MRSGREERFSIPEEGGERGTFETLYCTLLSACLLFVSSQNDPPTQVKLIDE